MYAAAPTTNMSRYIVPNTVLSVSFARHTKNITTMTQIGGISIYQLPNASRNDRNRIGGMIIMLTWVMT